MDTPLMQFLKFMGIEKTDPHVIPYLEQERSVITEAYNQGYRDGEMLEDSIKGDGDISEFTDAESYFTDNFTNQ